MTRQNYEQPIERGLPPYGVGDRVMIVIPDLRRTVDGQYHGKRGTVTECWTDDLGIMTGNPLDDWHFTVDLDSGGTFFARYVDLQDI